MGVARASALVERPPDEALERYVDVRSWPSFVDGFARVLGVSSSWPVEGSEVTWQSTPEGRGRVSERVVAYEAPPPAPDVAPQSRPARLVTEVADDSLTGTQTATFAPDEGGTRVDLELDYELTQRGPLTGVTDFLFIRRAIRDSLRRTLRRFAAQAAADRSEPIN
jgi:polyketide cyclase/dehydrase/lipid transport protein